METTSIIAMTRQDTLGRQLDVLANNLANMNTSGFKGEKVMFIEHLARSRGGGSIFRARNSRMYVISPHFAIPETVRLPKRATRSMLPLPVKDILPYGPNSANATHVTGTFVLMKPGNSSHKSATLCSRTMANRSSSGHKIQTSPYLSTELFRRTMVHSANCASLTLRINKRCERLGTVSLPQIRK